MQVNLQWNLYSNTKIHCDTDFKPDLHKPTVLKHLRPAESGEGAAGLSVLTCPGETSGGTPCSTLTKPICRFTAQSTGALLLVRPSPQSSLYTLRSCWSTITHTHMQNKRQKHTMMWSCVIFFFCVCVCMCVYYLLTRSFPVLCFYWSVSALLSYIQQFVLTLRPGQTAKLGWKHTRTHKKHIGTWTHNNTEAQ